MIQLESFDNRSFSRGVSRPIEAAWVLVRAILFMHSLPVPSLLKSMALRLFGAKIGKHVVIRSRVNISMPWRLCVGDHVWIGEDVAILSLEKVSIGSNCCISQRAFLCTGSHDFTRETFDLIVKPIAIESGCWVGAQCFIGPGVTMSKSSQSLAGAVVVSSVGSGMTVGGVPAKARIAH